MINCEKKLERLLVNLDYKLLNGDISNVDIKNLVFDSRKANPGDLFICLEGSKFDSHEYITELSDKGIKLFIVNANNKNIKNALISQDDVVIAVKDTRIALAVVSNNYFRNPSNDMKIIGITGTKGKTTTSFMIKKILEEDGIKTGLIGTIGVYYGDEFIETENTTPESYFIHKYFAEMKDRGINICIMEVSSQSLKYNRVYGIKFFYSIWTNIMPEHIGENEHTDYNDYLTSKLKIFSMSSNAVVNNETDNFDDVVNVCKNNRVAIFIKGENIDYDISLPGKYNIDNATLSYRFALSFGISERIIKRALKKVIVPGRSEVVFENDEFKVIVDFAHEANGAKNFLNMIREEKPKRLVTIFGCGGNRSKDRRYGMGDVVGELSDFVIVTADNSRYENVLDIISDIETTLSKHKKKDNIENGYIVKEVRKDAIGYAIRNHKKGDVICVIGKGHETANEENGVKTHFSDREAILEIINEK